MRKLALAMLPAVAIAMVGLVRCYPHTIDDAFIFLEYARHGGLAFNVGEHVEGHSNPLWVLLLLVSPTLGWCKALGIAAALATIVSVGHVAHRLSENVVAAGLAAFVVASHPGIAFYATGGLGTSLTLLLASAAVGCLLLERRKLGYAALGAMLLTRPEMPLVWLVIVGFRLRKDRTEAKLAALSLLPFAGLLILRFAVYGSLVANTFFAKPSTLFSHPSGALGYLMDSGSIMWLVLVMLAALALKSAAIVALAVAAQLGFALYSGGDWMPHGRFLLPALPLLAMAAAMSLKTAAVRERSQVVAGVVAVAALIQSWSTVSFWGELDDDRTYDHALRSDNNVVMAQWMRDNLPGDKSVLCDEIGAIGYYTSARVIDMWGLIDRDVARLLRERGFNPYNSPVGTDLRKAVLEELSKTLLAREPDYIVIDYRAPPTTAPDRRLFMPYTMRGLARNMRDEDYALLRAFPIQTHPPKTFLLYARR